MHGIWEQRGCGFVSSMSNYLARLREIALEKERIPNTSEPADRKSDDLRTNASEEVLNFYTIAKDAERICNIQLFLPQLTAMIPLQSSCSAHSLQAGSLDERPATTQ